MPCPFCDLGELERTYESELAFAFRDRFPVSEGHTLVVSRRHVATWFEASAEEQAALMAAISRVKAQLDALTPRPDGYNVGFNAGAAAGQTVMHLHVHVIPRYAGDMRDPRGGVRHVIPERGNYTRDMRPRLVRGGEDALATLLLADLDGAVRADIAVAFVFRSGLEGEVLRRLEDMLARPGSRLRLVTGDYQDVTEPDALRTLLRLKEEVAGSADMPGEVELRVFETGRAGTSFHPKAYLVYSDDEAGIAYVGSSNLTRTALWTGVEWNLRVRDDAGTRAARESFETLFHHDAVAVLTPDWVRQYEARRRPPMSGGRAATAEVAPPEELPPDVPQPHEIQEEALDALRETRDSGNRAGLVVLATGLGKTWLSAFDSRGFARVLFVAHRDEILRQAMRTFARIRPEATVGLYTGAEKVPDAELIFASVQTLSRDAHRTRFAEDAFDYIVVDEFHHAAAKTYREILDHFEPRFLLGLTATPERTDGGDLLALCQHNLVYECHLAEGITRKRLAPFHYFGVPDPVEYENIPWRSRKFDEEELTAAVATTERAQNALEQLEHKGGKRVLGFCVSRTHADFMRDYFREHTALRVASVHSGEKSDPRTASLEKMAAGELDVLFCVDMFNEGLDVPSIDTVLMLRPTESKVLWLQQLGRGLRRSEAKSHLRVIDYIGNHRVFLNKPAALLEAIGKTVRRPQEIAHVLRSEDYELPDGCEVTYDLGAIALLEKLFPPSRRLSAVREWYEAFREQAERRPTALEAFHSGFNPRALQREHGSWFEFVRDMGDGTEDEAGALDSDREFLVELEITPMTRSYTVVLLQAMLQVASIPGEAALSTLASGVQRLVRRSAALQRDFTCDIEDAAALERLLRENPVSAWAGRDNGSGRPFFTFDDGMFATSPAVLGKGALAAMSEELLEWRLAQYLMAQREGARLRVLRNASGQPILKLDRKRHELPEGWTPIAADGATYSANYVKEYVNVLRERADDGPNMMREVVEGWFGPDAGKPGTKYEVLQRRSVGGRYVWEPVLARRIDMGHQVLDANGAAVDARFDVEERDGELTVVHMSRGAGRNDQYAAGLELLLERLAALGSSLTRIAVESGQTKTVPLDKRTIRVEGAPYPIELDGRDIAELRLEIGRAVAEIGRAPDAKGSGNNTKRIRLWVDLASGEAELREKLRAGET